eukprot:IDg16017t1
MSDLRAAGRLRLLPFSALYAAFALGLSLGVFLRQQPDTPRAPILDELLPNIWPLPEFKWDEPQPLLDVVPPAAHSSNMRRLSWDVEPLNWSVERCRRSHGAHPECAYMNATGAT